MYDKKDWEKYKKQTNIGNKKDWMKYGKKELNKEKSQEDKN